MALDVTEEATLNARLESVNRLLEAANEELRASMLQVKRVAEEEAVMRMRTRVHDTVGSRLSILHRYLEDGREDPQTLEKITGLLSSIVDDLAEPSRPAASAGRGWHPSATPSRLWAWRFALRGSCPQTRPLPACLPRLFLRL